MGTQTPTPKGAEPHPIFGPRLLWPNGCMDQDATWHGGRPRPTRDCVRCGPSYPQVGWFKMPLGTEVGLGPGHIVLDGDPAPSATQKKHSSPHFSGAYFALARSPISATSGLLLSVITNRWYGFISEMAVCTGHSLS